MMKKNTSDHVYQTDTTKIAHFYFQIQIVEKNEI